MNKLISATFAATLLAGLSIFADMAQAGELFPDKRLDAAVRKYVFEKKNNEEPLTEEDVRDISSIVAKGKKIQNLAGLEKCTSLALLDLANNEISDVAPIKELKKLQSVNLSKNKIKDLASLSGLTGIQYLHLAGNEISDLAPIGKLEKLTALYLSGNKIEDIKPLGGLKKLWSLYLNGNQIDDIKPIADLKNLSSLDLRDNGVSDLSPLSGLTEFKYLMLDRNKIEDIEVLVAMAKKDKEGDTRFAPFWRIYLTGNPLSDAAKGDQAKAIKEIGGRSHTRREEEIAPSRPTSVAENRELRLARTHDAGRSHVGLRDRIAIPRRRR